MHGMDAWTPSQRTVLLPVDMQCGFDMAGWPPRWNANADTNGMALLHAWRHLKWPIIHIRHDSVTEGSTLALDHIGNAFRPGFEPTLGEAVIGKSVNAAFIGTDLDLRLRRLAVDAIVVFGISTDMCVSTTVRVGANLGYRMVLVEDACDCFALPDGRGDVVPAGEIHRAHVATLRFEFAKVLTTQEILSLV